MSCAFRQRRGVSRHERYRAVRRKRSPELNYYAGHLGHDDVPPPKKHTDSLKVL